MHPPICSSAVAIAAISSDRPLPVITVGSQLARKNRQSKFMKNMTHSSTVDTARCSRKRWRTGSPSAFSSRMTNRIAAVNPRDGSMRESSAAMRAWASPLSASTRIDSGRNAASAGANRIGRRAPV